MKIVDTDNFGGDYPNESFLHAPNLNAADAKTIADILNSYDGEDSLRYFKIVNNDYTLQPGFEA
ncbi:hypothetical protein KAR91_18815 [Candidatus Pacearchaeota archaeon]|nr:hypothetical protein [Candidatus Pacearchaeota archaeon]